MVKNVNTSFLNMLRYHFSLEAVLQGMAKNNPTEKQIEAKIIKRHKSMRHENLRKRKCKVYYYKLQG